MTKSCAFLVCLVWALAFLGLAVSHTAHASGVLDAVALQHADMRFVDRDTGQKHARPFETASATPGARSSQWNALVREAATGNLRTALDAVQARFNRFRYVSDAKAGSRKDHWSDPEEFLKRGGGDCEDFAIAKYAALVQLGVDPADMAVMVYVDQRRRVVHAVLLVALGGETYVLDSLRDTVIKTRTATFGRPLFAVSAHTKRIFVTRRTI